MILVTGGAGLLGSELISQLLNKGKMVRAIYNRNVPVFESPLFQKIHCNILDVATLEEAMSGITEVYHCAAMVSFKGNDSALLYKINVEGTANVVNAAVNEGVRRFIHVSSVASLGRLRNEIVDENSEWTEKVNNSNYGKSKFLGEMEVWRGMAEGLEAAIVNPSVILGPGDWSSGSTALFKSVFNGFPWYTEGTSGFVDVRDVAKAMIILMNSDVSQQRFIISAENISYRELFNRIAGSFNKKQPHRRVNKTMAALVWRAEKIRSFFTGNTPLVTRETTGSAMSKVSYNNSKFLKQFPGFRYRPIEETISHICAVLQHKVNNP